MNDTAEIVRKSVARTIGQLTKMGQGKRAGKFTSWGTAMLAKLRRAAGTMPVERMDVLELTAYVLPNELTREDRERAVLAAHIALTLFGLHQQGSRRSVNRTGVGFGEALHRIFITSERANEGVYRRFSAMATASDIKALSHYARDLVSLLRAKGVGFDYPRFAADLYRYQLGPEQRDRVRMQWGLDFYALDKKEASADADTEYTEEEDN